jgi:hypothetical protein
LGNRLDFLHYTFLQASRQGLCGLSGRSGTLGEQLIDFPAAGAKCTISVTFTPAASGARTATLSIADNAGGSPQTLSLTGTGTAPAVSLFPTSLSFGSQPVGTTSTPQTITLTNTGSATLSTTSLAFTRTNTSDFAQTDACGSSVAAGAHCTIAVMFTPAASGALHGHTQHRGQCQR